MILASLCNLDSRSSDGENQVVKVCERHSAQDGDVDLVDSVVPLTVLTVYDLLFFTVTQSSRLF